MTSGHPERTEQDFGSTKMEYKGYFWDEGYIYVESPPGRDKSILGTALHGRDRAGQPKRERKRGRGKKNLERRGFKMGFPPSH